MTGWKLGGDDKAAATTPGRFMILYSRHRAAASTCEPDAIDKEPLTGFCGQKRRHQNVKDWANSIQRATCVSLLILLTARKSNQVWWQLRSGILEMRQSWNVSGRCHIREQRITSQKSISWRSAAELHSHQPQLFLVNLFQHNANMLTSVHMLLVEMMHEH